MRILIADESVAAAKGLRAFFGKSAQSKSSRKHGGRKRPKNELASGQLTVSLPAKPGKHRSDDIACACSNLDLGDQPELAATILDALGMSLLNTGCIAEGAPLIRLARETRLNFFGNKHPAYAASENSYSRLLREEGDYAGAAAAAENALSINRAVFGETGFPVATSLNELGVTQLQRGDYASAEQSAKDGLAILQTPATQSTDPNLTRLLDLRGRAETELGNLAQAHSTYAELLPLTLKELGTTDHPKYAAQLSNAGLAKEQDDRPDEAEADYREALRLYSRTLLNRSCYPNLSDAYANLGSVLRDPRRQGEDAAEAEKALRSALAINQQIRKASHPLLANDYANLGRWLYDAGSKREASASFRKATGILAKNVARERIAADNVYVAEANTWYGRVLVEAGTREGAEEAEKVLEGAAEAWSKYADGAAGAAVAKACLGHALAVQNKELARAVALLQESLPVLQAELGADADFTARVAGWLSDASGGKTSPAAPTAQAQKPAKASKKK